MPIAVALDARGAAAAGEWIRAAAPTYSCLIDEPHVVAELYGMVNVPMAVWIDESGAIVRPAEIAGSSEAFRTDLDRVTFDRTERGLVEASRVREIYSDAVRAWVLEGGWWPKQSEVHQALRIAPAPKGVAIVSEDESNAALAHAAAVRITSADTTKPWRKRLEVPLRAGYAIPGDLFAIPHSAFEPSPPLSPPFARLTRDELRALAERLVETLEL